MNVSNMQQRDIAERIKPEELRFTQVLLRDRAHESAVACRESSGGNADVKNFTASNHRSLFQIIPGRAAARPPEARAMKRKARGPTVKRVSA